MAARNPSTEVDNLQHTNKQYKHIAQKNIIAERKIHTVELKLFQRNSGCKPITVAKRDADVVRTSAAPR